jgi:hypothetical protein
MNIKSRIARVLLLGVALVALAGCTCQRACFQITTTRCCPNLLQDGNFEDPVLNTPSYVAWYTGASFGGGAWSIWSSDSEANVAVVPNAYNDKTPSPLFYDTPDGKNFAYIGFYAGGSKATNRPPYPQCMLCQTINTDLEGGKRYKLSFYQSTLRPTYAPDLQVTGSVLVEVRLQDNSAPAIYSEHFKVCAGSPWMAQGGDIVVPEKATGKYKIVLTNDNASAVCAVDALWICEK